MKKNRLLKEILSTSIYILAVLLFTIFMVKYVCQRTEIVGSSMEDTLYDKDNIIVEKVSYRFNAPQRFDIIVFPYQYDKNTHYVKRIIGLPGEKVYIDSMGNIFINDILLYEKYGKEIIEDPGVAANPITLGPDEYFVLGDNRNNSKDSRFSDVGAVKRDDIIGKAWLLIWPLNEFGKIGN